MIYASFVLQLARVNNRDFRLRCPGARSLSLNVFDNIFALQKPLKERTKVSTIPIYIRYLPSKLRLDPP